MGSKAAAVACAAFLLALLLGAASAPAVAAAPPTLNVEVIGMGTVTGLGINCGAGNLTCYSAYGSQAPTLTETPSTGWVFSGWADDTSGCAASTTCPVTLTGNNTATAVFTTAAAVQTATFGVSLAANHGVVKNGSTNPPIDCEPGASPPVTTCSATVVQGSTLTVTEQPDAGYFFGGWAGACSGTGVSCAVYLSANLTASANFVSTASQNLTVTVSGGGNVTGGGISCGAGSTCDAPEPPNSTITLTASPQSGYAFTGWGNGCSGLQTTCTVQMDAARTVTAAFAPLVQLSVTVSGTGSVSGGGIGCDSGQTCTANEAPNSTVTLTASPKNTGGVVFWSGCSSASGTLCTVTIGTSPLAVTATFSGGSPPPVATFALNVGVTGDGYVTSTVGSAIVYCTAADGPGCVANVQSGTSLTLTATPATGTSGDFLGWSGACSAFTSTTCTLTMTAAANVQARFVGSSTTYVLSAQVSGNGTITGAGLNCGTTCTAPQAASARVTLTANPSFGATFTGWGGACTGTVSTCTVTMTQARSVTATFAAASATSAALTVGITGAGNVKATGTIDCAGKAAASNTCTHEYAIGQTVTLTESPAAGYAFAGWSGACVGKKKTCTVSMTAAKTVDATFVQPVLVATARPTVVKTAAGFRVTLHFAATERGSVKLVAKRTARTVGTRTATITPGRRKLTFTVAGAGRYVVTLTLTGATGRHTLAWRITVHA